MSRTKRVVSLIALSVLSQSFCVKMDSAVTLLENAAARSSMITELVALSSMALFPFFIILFSSFIKISIVSSLLRNAIGTQQAPANQIINGMSIIMSVYVMYPTLNEAYNLVVSMEEEHPETVLDKRSPLFIVRAIKTAKEPFRKFLYKNSSVDQKSVFLNFASQSFQDTDISVTEDSFIVLMPAFIMTQIRDGFVVGALVYLPFFVTDMVVSVILTTLGMMMMAPLAIALPMKVFLVVFLNGWSLIILGLVKSFA